MKNPIVTVMIVVCVAILANHALMIAISVDSWPDQIDVNRQTPDIQIDAPVSNGEAG